MDLDIKSLDQHRPVLIAGPTASGKSALAMAVADYLGGIVLNADALQVYSDWRILTARPSKSDEATVQHGLYGHVSGELPYSVGNWLREIGNHLDGDVTPIIVGGTGLYFSALTEGLADIPETPEEIRAIAMSRIQEDGALSLIGEIDLETAARIDQKNPMRVQRAWEVLKATGKGLARWQDETGPPLLSLDQAQAFLIDAPKAWLTPRIERRFDTMLDKGALDEARANEQTWRSSQPSAKAIGAAELIAYVRGETTLEEARLSALIATRQYAKRQRSWFRSRMKSWSVLATRGGKGLP